MVLTSAMLVNVIQCLEHFESLKSLESDMGCVDGTIIGTGRSDYTQGSTLYNLQIDSKQFALIDIPGIEGDESQYERTIKNSLEQAHIIFYVNGSGKKPEKDSLDKIKKYMRDGTSVYAVFNTHCKAKKNRVAGIDKTYTEELKDAYNKQQEIIIQTEEKLQAFLGKNFKGNININGLLAFCALALNERHETTIKDEQDKGLRNDQTKYINEYSGNVDTMIEDSHITDVEEVIEQKVYNFEADIIEENLKKLRNRMREMLWKINSLKTLETKRINGFINIYSEYQDSCRNAKDDFIREMKHIGRGAVADAFNDLLSDLFEQIEKDEGKSKVDDIQKIVEDKKSDVIQKIQDGVNEKMDRAKKNFYDNLEDAQSRLKKDMDRQQIQFEVALSAESVTSGDDFEKALKYNLKDFGKHAFTVGSLAISGAGIGSMFCPGLGTAIGAGIGAILGVLSSIWNFFISRQKRINNAKAKIKRAIDEQIDDISEQLENEIKNLKFEGKIEDTYSEIHEVIETQKRSLEKIKLLLNSVYNELQIAYKSIAKER